MLDSYIEQFNEAADDLIEQAKTLAADLAKAEQERDALRHIIVKYVDEAAATDDERHMIEACDKWAAQENK